MVAAMQLAARWVEPFFGYYLEDGPEGRRKEYIGNCERGENSAGSVTPK